MNRVIFEPEHELFPESVTRFFRAEIAPHSQKWREQGFVDREAFRKTGAQGYLPNAFYQCRYTGLSDTELGGGLTLRPTSLLDVLARGSHEIGTHGEHMRFGLIKSEIAEHTTVSGCRMLNIAFAHDFNFLSDRSGVPPAQCPLCESSEFSFGSMKDIDVPRDV
jgi:Acyl-CoA dehydrogenase, N-terminal domain